MRYFYSDAVITLVGRVGANFVPSPLCTVCWWYNELSRTSEGALLNGWRSLSRAQCMHAYTCVCVCACVCLCVWAFV